MAVTRDDLLHDAIKESLTLYQRSLTWATTAALSSLLITQRLADATPNEVEILYGKIGAPMAWFIAQVLYVVFGALALSAIHRYQRALALLRPGQDILEAIQLFPSLATQPGRFFRLGSVFLPVGATVASWVMEAFREHPHGAPTDAGWYIGLAITLAILFGPYVGILNSLRAIRLGTLTRKGALTGA